MTTSTAKKTMTLNLADSDMEALEEICKEKEKSPAAEEGGRRDLKRN